MLLGERNLDGRMLVRPALARAIRCSRMNAVRSIAVRRPSADQILVDQLLSASISPCETPFVFLTGMRGEDVHTNRFPLAPVVEKPYQPLLQMGAILRALGTG